MKKGIKLFATLCSLGAIASCGSNSGNTDKPVDSTVDLTKYPNYVENVDSLQYEFGEKQKVQPFWKGNTIYNESVLLVKDQATGEVSGNLMFKPTKILSVRDFTLKTDTYKINQDFTIKDNKIIRTENSKITFRTDAELRGETCPEGFKYVNTITNVLTDLVNFGGGAVYTESPFYYGAQVWVSYVYDVAEIDPHLDKYPQYDLDKLPKLKAKLEAKEDLKIVGMGDSVLEGCSSSKHFNHEPFMDTFFDMTCDTIASEFGIKVDKKNLSKGGEKASWGCQKTQINSVIAEKPDLFLIHFGINDLGSNRGPIQYSDDIESMILDVQGALPDCEIILMSPFGPNPAIYNYDKMDEYCFYLDELATKYEGVKFLDMFGLSKMMCQPGAKKYLDMSANGINHVNDYASRLYVGAIMSTISKK